jgi:hypothetical protein
VCVEQSVRICCCVVWRAGCCVMCVVVRLVSGAFVRSLMIVW